MDTTFDYTIIGGKRHETLTRRIQEMRWRGPPIFPVDRKVLCARTRALATHGLVETGRPAALGAQREPRVRERWRLGIPLTHRTSPDSYRFVVRSNIGYSIGVIVVAETTPHAVALGWLGRLKVGIARPLPSGRVNGPRLRRKRRR